MLGKLIAKPLAFATFVSSTFVFTAVITGFSTAEARCWYEGPSWARIKVCDIERPQGTPIEDLQRELDNCINQGRCSLPADELWGEAGRAAYQAAATTMAKRSPTGKPLDTSLKALLRSHFGDLVDRVTIHWGTPGLDTWSASQLGINLSGMDSAGQTYGHDIYIAQQKPSSYSPSLVKLILHELTHSQQYEKYSSSLSNFGYHYFKKYKQAGQSYENNELERQAEANANRLMSLINSKLRNLQVAETFGYMKNSRLVTTVNRTEPMEGHINWALNTGQSPNTVKNEILSDLRQARTQIAQSPSMQSCQAFGHMKNGMLILLRGTTEPHAGHVNWCRDRLNEGNWGQVVSAMDQEFVQPIRKALPNVR